MLQSLALLSRLSPDCPAVIDDIADDLFGSYSDDYRTCTKHIVKDAQVRQWDIGIDEEEIWIGPEHAKLLRKAFSGAGKEAMERLKRLPTPGELEGLVIMGDES